MFGDNLYNKMLPVCLLVNMHREKHLTSDYLRYNSDNFV